MRKNERTNIRQRQAEGIEAAKAQGASGLEGRRWKRRSISRKLLHLWEKKKINIQEAANAAEMSESTFYRKARMYRTPKKISWCK